uniref:EGF-like domain-containing protein n=1 Tax=Mesocestoides corti TaxID=53468 RepID=A0A5K3EGP9_MESCO
MWVHRLGSALLISVILVKLAWSDILAEKARVRKNCTDEEAAACSPGSCRVAPRHLPETYTCTCTPTTYLTREFTPEKKPPFVVSCKPRPYDPCQVCHEQHTFKCTKVASDRALCHCYSEYSVTTHCHSLKNGCQDVPAGSSLSGNAACRIDNGNLCIPILGSERYKCVCLRPFRSSKTLKFPNCLGEIESPCDNQLCVGFNPAQPSGPEITPHRVIAAAGLGSSGDEHAACDGNSSCKCPANWFGDHCASWRGGPERNSWTAWSPCYPHCVDANIFSGKAGISGVGYRASQAFCTVRETRVCEGTFKEWKRCKIQTLCTGEKRKTFEIAPEVALAVDNLLLKYTDEVRNILAHLFQFCSVSSLSDLSLS